MPPVKRPALKILNEYGKVQSELIGKAVVLPTERQARLRTFGWMNCTGFGFRSKVMMEDGRSQLRARPARRPHAAQSVFLSEHSEQDEKPYLGQEGDARDCGHEGARVHHPDRLLGGGVALARAATNETRPSCLIRTVHELAVPMREQLTSDAGGLI